MAFEMGWLESVPLWGIGLLLLAVLAAAATGGSWLRQRHGAPADGADNQEGYVVSAVLGLLALLTGFTFSLAIDRFETRRENVLVEANAIGTTYLRAQLIEEPHRTRLSTMIVAYVDNRIALASAEKADVPQLMAKNDQMVTDLWTATVAAFPSLQKIGLTVPFLQTMNQLIDMDEARKVGRFARVPSEILAALLAYLAISAGVLGYVLTGRRGRAVAGFLLALLAFSVLIILDVNRPMEGMITESQGPMIQVRDSLKAAPPGTFDRLNGVTTP